MNHAILSIALVVSLAATTAQAEGRRLLDRVNLNLNAQGSIARQAARPDTLVREITRTDASGETASRSDIVTGDGEAGIASRSLSGVTADGRSYTAESLVETTANGVIRERTGSDSEGQSRSGTSTLLVDKEAGTLTQEIAASVSQNDGESRSLTGESVITRTDEGLVREGQASDGEGNSRSVLATTTLDKEDASVTKQLAVTRVSGEGESTSVTGQSVVARTDDGFTGESQLTDSQGSTYTRSVTASVNKQEGSIAKEVKTSGPNGEASNSTLIARKQPAVE